MEAVFWGPWRSLKSEWSCLPTQRLQGSNPGAVRPWVLGPNKASAAPPSFLLRIPTS